ncbi:hypothetical protein IAD21_01965 [Abditibacteriota bacterium]|nr:hypothetical protein IAD21_01965 [Abditibacteriota bacterium]
MKRPLKIFLFALTVIVVIGGVLWMRSLASWRPVKIGRGDGLEMSVFYLSGDEHTLLSNRPGNTRNFPYINDITTGKSINWPEREPAYWTFSRTVPELTASVERKGNQGELRVREVRNGHLKRAFHWPAQKPFLPSLFLSSNGKTVGAVQNFCCFLWNIESGQLIRRVKLNRASLPRDSVVEYGLSRDGKRLIGCTKGPGRTWDATSGKILLSWKGVSNQNFAFFSADAHIAVYTWLSTTEFQTYYFVDTATGKVTGKLDENVTPNSMQGDEIFLPHKSNCQVFDTFTGRLVRQLPGPRLSDGRILRATHNWIYTASVKNEIFRWRAR